MKKVIAALFLSAVVFAVSPVLGQQKYEVITVQNVEVHATVRGANDRFELQCEADVWDCNALQPGSYVMVRLPENSGPYVYPNVEVYPTPVNPETANLGKKLGVYCLIEK
jgi:succinylglutamate desuccinylase